MFWVLTASVPPWGLGTAGSILHEAALVLLSEWNVLLSHKRFS